MNTLTGIEAERVGSILKFAGERLQLLSYVPPEWDDALAAELEQKPNHKVVTQSLQRQWELEETFLSIRDSMSAAVISLQKQVHRGARALCRNLSADREALSYLMDHSNGPHLGGNEREEVKKFIRYLADLNSHAMSSMMTTVEDEASNRHALHELTERERQAEESKENLQGKLTELREEKDRTTYSLDQTLRRLRLELDDLTKNNEIELDSVKRGLEEAVSKATADHELRMRQLQDQIDGLSRTYAEAAENNHEKEVKLRKDKAKAESALSAKVATYDEDMAQLLVEIEEKEALINDFSGEFAALQEHFDKVDADHAYHREEKALLAALQRRDDSAMSILHGAATYIQKMARGRQTRAEMAKLKGKGKKGKGKKGKK
jgi:hypothetical protein